jgi:hypothetical protein
MVQRSDRDVSGEFEGLAPEVDLRAAGNGIDNSLAEDLSHTYKTVHEMATTI